MSEMFNEEAEQRALVISDYVRKSTYTNNIGSVFESLGIPFKKGGSFWVVNEAELEYLYYDFCKAARNVLKELHPDVGGDAEEFKKFSRIVALIKKSFWKKGVGKDISLFKALAQEEKGEKYKNKTDKRNYNRFLKDLDGLEKLSIDEIKHGEQLSSSVTFTPIEQVRKNHRATLARVRRKRNRKEFRAQRRERYQRLKAEGRLPQQKLEVRQRYQKKHRRKLKNAHRRYREKNREKILQWKRNFYWRKKGFAEPPAKIKKPKKRGLNRRICERCGEKYKPKNRIQKHCSTKCSRALKSQRRLQRLKNIPKPEKLILSGICQLEGCDIVFQSMDSRQIYCCKEHGIKAGNIRRYAKCRAEKQTYERQCNNSKCNNFFSTTHKEKIYCGERCTRAVAQRKFREKQQLKKQ